MRINNLLFILISFVLIAGLVSCESEQLQPQPVGSATSEQVLPGAAEVYIISNYPNESVIAVDRDYDGGLYCYEVNLSNGTDLYFACSGLLIFKDREGEDAQLTDLPLGVREYVRSNYPTQEVAEIDVDFNEEYCFEVILENGVDLYFDCAGNLTRQGVINPGSPRIINSPTNIGSLPQAVFTYLQANHTGIEICYTETETDPGSSYRFEVALTNGEVLFFGEEGNLIFSETDDDLEC